MPLPSIQLIHIWTVEYEAHKYKGCFFNLMSTITLIGKGEGYLDISVVISVFEQERVAARGCGRRS